MPFLTEIIHSDIVAVVLVDQDCFEYIVEEKKQKEDTKQLRHLDHAEDHLIRDGGQGFHDMLSSLTMTHEYLAGGRKRPEYALTTKMDGSPSVVWGHDPNSGKFFVGTKSFFNKTPKVNFSDKDIDTNHGAQPPLADKLKMLLKSLKKVSPKKGVFQGDLMYTGHDITDYNDKLSFTPNTITYNVDKNSIEGKKILKSKVGIAPHTQYQPMEDGNLQAQFGVDHAQFGKHDDVHLFNTKVSGPFHYPSTDRKKFMDSVGKALEGFKKIADKTEVFGHHEKLLLAYINQAVKTKRENSVEGYISFLHRQFAKRMDTVKEDKTKQAIRKELNNEMQNVAANKTVFSALFQAHKHVQNAKNILLNVLSDSSPYKESILGNKSKPEGYVASYRNKPMKLVDRQHFSVANFDFNEKVNPEDNPVVMHWGRFNPGTKGHEKLLSKGADIARRIGAKQVTVATNKSGDKENPLKPQDKLKWLKTLFPGQDVALAGHEASTIIAQLQQLHHKGVKDVTIVAGADRVPEYSRILAKYNGPNKLFQFKRARVVSSGERDPDSSGAEGASGTKVRQAAEKNDYNSFKVGMPLNLPDEKSKRLFHHLRAEMDVVKIGSDTDAHALSVYTSRPFGDKVGDDARKEVQKRKAAGKWKGHKL